MWKIKEWAKDFYTSSVWKSTREAYLCSQDYICERCGDVAKLVHHKRYITKKNINDISITLSWENLEALCQDCHNKEHHKRVSVKRYRFDSSGNIIPPI